MIMLKNGDARCRYFYELLRREDGITCLLEEYRTHELDVEKFSEGVADPGPIWDAEIFGCQFIRHYVHCFTDSEYALASQIVEEKKGLYSSLKDALLSYVDFKEIEPAAGEKADHVSTNYLNPEEIQEKEDKLAAALLQIQSKESSLQTETPDTEDSGAANQEEDNENIMAEQGENGSHQGLTIVMGIIIIIGVACVGCGFILISRRRKD